MNNLVINGKSARFIAEACRHYLTVLQARLAEADGLEAADLATDLTYCQSLLRILDEVGA